jgi:hypothetical protein
MEQRHDLAQRALVVTKPRRGAGGWSTAGWGGTGRAGVGCGATGVAPPGPGGARPMPSVAGVAVRRALGGSSGVCGSDTREREAGERKGGAGYYTHLCSSG